MAVINVLRPISVRKVGGASAVPSGTLATVSADNNDATYIQMPLASTGNNWNLRMEPHTPAATYQRHQVRARIRIRSDVGTMFEDIDLGRGSNDYLEYQTVPVTDTVAEQITDWYQTTAFGLANSGALSDLNIGGGYPLLDTGVPTEARTSECYVDVDCRQWPVYLPEVRDNAGVNRNGGTVTDTTQPTLFIGAVNYDDLPAADWSVTVRIGSIAGVVVFSDSGSGVPPATVDVTTGLADGVYYATWSVRSTIRGADLFDHAISYSFTIENTVPPPSPPLVTATAEYGGYRVEWTNPGGQAWDNDYVVAEVWRDDCTGSQRIATIPDGLNGSYLDLAIPQLDPVLVGAECVEVALPCDITYRVRYVGYVSATTVQLPNTIPQEMILGWPGTVASIPSGWSRVTALDGLHVRGATTTGAPTITGGSTSHTHTTPNHLHGIGAHSHNLGGNTSSSTTSVSSPRYNGGTIAQAEDPHSHPRPSATGSRNAQNTGSAAPGTNATNNIPPTREVIWIKSDGAQPSYPQGVLAYSVENVSGWTNDATSDARFLKGVATGNNGGATFGAAPHTHTVLSHTHTGFAHDHSISSTGLSAPASSVEMGPGVGPPALPRHNHPMNVLAGNTGNLNANNGGLTTISSLEPINRRLRVLRNSSGGIQTRIIGLYTGAIADLNPVLSVCNGANGTPDMRGYFARDNGSDSVNSTAGFTSHTHAVGNHTHSIPSHAHEVTVGTSNTGWKGTASPAPRGPSPTVDHTHTSGNTAAAVPSISSNGDDVTGSGSHLPPYKEVHFVRLNGTVVNDPLAVPELRISEFSSVTVPSFTYGDDLDRLSSLTDRITVLTDRSHDYPRLVVQTIPLDGGLQTVSTTLAGEDMTLTIAVEGLPAIERLEDMLSNDRVYWSPVGGTPGWYAPGGWTVTAPAPNVKVVQVTMVRQPWPTTPEPSVYL